MKRPMLACEAPKKLNFPLVASPKLDGIRATVQNGILLSRSLKPIPNKFIQSAVNWGFFEGVDGELIVGAPNAHDVYNKTCSGVMSHNGEPDFNFYIFDAILDMPFKDRFHIICNAFGKDIQVNHINVHEHHWVTTQQRLESYEELVLSSGFEGLILRDPHGPYKHGRSTKKEGYMLKLKRWKDSEAEIIGFVEQMHNANEAKINELGYTERSSSKEHKTPMDTLGAFVVKDNDKIFNIGSGFTHEQRKLFWEERNTLIGTIVKYKHFPIGAKNKPRQPIFIGFRFKDDM